MNTMKKKLPAVIAVTALLCMALTGCGEKTAPADQTIGALFELAARNNAAPMKELLGFASEDDVRSAFFEEGADTELVDNLSAQLADAGIEMSGEDIQSFTDSMMTMLNKITYTARITSEDKSDTVVTLSVNGYSDEAMTEATKNAADAMTASLTEEDQLAIANGDTDVLSTYMHQYLADFTASLAALEPNTDPVEFTVNCEKLIVEVGDEQKVAWLPVDMDSFSDNVEAALFR